MSEGTRKTPAMISLILNVAIRRKNSYVGYNMKYEASGPFVKLLKTFL